MGLRWFIFTQWLWIVESMQYFWSMPIKNLYLVPVWNSLCKHSFPLGIELDHMWMDIRQNIKEHLLLRELRNIRIWFYSEFIFMWVKMSYIGCNLYFWSRISITMGLICKIFFSLKSYFDRRVHSLDPHDIHKRNFYVITDGSQHHCLKEIE